MGTPAWAVWPCLVHCLLVLALALGACGDDPAQPPGAAQPDADGERARVRQDPVVPVAHSTEGLLERVARDTGLEFSGGGETLPFPQGDVGAMPPEKLLRRVAEGAGLVSAVDKVALAEGRGGLYLTNRFLLAGATAELAALVGRLDTLDAAGREGALAALGEASGALRPLVLGGVLATDESADVRAEAAALLGEERDDRGVEALIAALGDDDAFVAQSARASLVLMGDSYVRPALLRAARYGAPRVREAAQVILDENFGVELDPDMDTAAPSGEVVNAVVVHDLEGLARCVRLDAAGTCELIVHARGRVIERRRGTLDGVSALLEALALCGAGEPPNAAPAPGADLAREPDSFVVHLVEPDGTQLAARGDLRDHPPAVRDAVTAVVTKAGALPTAELSAVYVAARPASDAEAEGAPLFSIPTEEGALQHALQSLGWPAACDAARLETIFGDTIGPWLVRWRDGYVELSVLHGATGSGD